MRKFWIVAASAAGLLVPAAASADTVSWRFTTGFDYSTGRYDEPVATNVYLVPLTVKAIIGDWSFRATTNLLNIHGPADLVVLDGNGGGASSGGNGSGGAGVGGVDPSGATIPKDNRNGLGDTTLAADYTQRGLFGTSLYADLGGQLRLPTGNPGLGLGTGAVDEVANLELGGDWTWGGAYVSGGRRFLGDARGFQRKDGWQVGAGVWADFAKYYEVGAYYDYRNAIAETLPDPKEIGVYLSYKLASEWKLQLDATKGLSSGSAVSDIGLFVTYRPDGGYR